MVTTMLTTTSKPKSIDLAGQIRARIPTLQGIRDNKGMNKHHISEALNGKSTFIHQYPMPVIESVLKELVTQNVLSVDANGYYKKL